MIVKELIEQLKKLDENMKIFISSDEEGSYFNALSIDELCVYKLYKDDINKHEIHTFYDPNNTKLNEIDQDELETVMVIWP